MKEVHGERSNQQLKVKVCSKLAVLSELKRWAAIESIDPRMSAIGAMMSQVVARSPSQSDAPSNALRCGSRRRWRCRCRR